MLRPMNTHSTTRICAYICLTGGAIALGLAAGQAGLAIAGVLLSFWAFLLFVECREQKTAAAGERPGTSET